MGKYEHRLHEGMCTVRKYVRAVVNPEGPKESVIFLFSCLLSASIGGNSLLTMRPTAGHVGQLPPVVFLLLCFLSCGVGRRGGCRLPKTK